MRFYLQSHMVYCKLLTVGLIRKERKVSIMKTSKKFFGTLCLFLIASMLLVCVAGCNTSGENNPENTPEATEEPSTVSITITYTNKKGEEIASTTGVGSASLEVGQSFERNGVITVTLSDNQQYMWFNFDRNLQDALIYCEDSTFTYKFDNKTSQYFPSSLVIGGEGQHINPTIKVWIPTKAELNTTRNIAVNPYDQGKAEGTYPHASTNSVHASTGEWDARNAIDGFTQGGGHGTYPYQSWGPEFDNKDMYWQVDFGKDVTVSGIGIAVRSDFDHDTPFTQVTVEFSDGSTQTVSLEKTADVQKITFDSEVTTSSIKIKEFEKASSGQGWTGFMEVEVYGVYGA